MLYNVGVLMVGLVTCGDNIRAPGEIQDFSDGLLMARESHQTMPVEQTDDKVILTYPGKPDTKVEILKFGATVISWTVDKKERLWLSEAAKLDGSKAVRGGIPLVFPVFGKVKDENHPTAPLPQHGFARNSTWEFLGQVTENPVSVQFGLGPENVDSELYKLWGGGKYDFTLVLTVTLSETNLTTEIEVENAGKEAFEFNWLFHTYYNVDDVTDTLATNLIDTECYDQLMATTYKEKAPMLSFHEEFDRIYKNVEERRDIQLIDKGNVLMTVSRKNLPDAVVWNPWINKSQGMGDFEPKSGYLNMVCIEPGHVADFVKLNKGDKWVAAQSMTLYGEIKVQTDIFSV